ncbi:hypothetical protein Patl1_06229 [Pistacia atlantica]|uniref:Uncharacterized protein n=1 Tax=Pistacia atlantica TaxID=434234 RepID=A0ACC1BSB4_9ROSI|nr:hypothetical protein Patl1_06229 [Pistacia atlantica]
MSWLRNAVNKAVEVGNKNNLTRTVRNYADTVVQQAGQAVAEGAKILQDRIIFHVLGTLKLPSMFLGSYVAGADATGVTPKFDVIVGTRSFRSVKQTIKRLEEAAISCRGPARVMLLRRWLIVLKQAERSSAPVSENKENVHEPHGTDEGKESPRKSAMLLYYDSDVGGEPLNFRDVFLQSQALEGITLSMILEAPSDEEISLLLEMFGLCLTGGKEVHNAITSSIQDLATALSSYQEEVLVKREELLQFAQGAISGLKINADIIRWLRNEELLTSFLVLPIFYFLFSGSFFPFFDLLSGRIDAEASDLKKKLDRLNVSLKASNEGLEQASEETTMATIENHTELVVTFKEGSEVGYSYLHWLFDLHGTMALKEALAQVRACSRLEGLLLKKKMLNNGDSPEIHAQKVEKLKVLSESLFNSTVKSEKRISDHRVQKEEALKVRVVKASEAGEKEKELSAEIAELEKERDHLEAELKKVNITLAAAQARLRNAKEEREQFDEANNQIVEHLKTKEDELLKSIAACRVEADVLNTWINFLEDTWVLQCSNAEIKDKQVNDELDKHEDYFVKLAISLLSAYKKELGPSIVRIEKFVENLKNLKEGSEEESRNEDSKELNPRKNLEEEYLNYEAKIITTFSVIDNMKEQFYAQREINSRKDDARVKELFDDIEKLRQEFEYIDRPNLELENPTPKADAPADAPSNEKPPGSPSNTTAQGITTVKPKINEHPEKSAVKAEQVLDHEAELAKLESEFGKVGQDYSGEEIGDWEFDELEREFKTEGSAASK